MKRYGMVIGLRAAVWPDVLKMIQQCHKWWADMEEVFHVD